MIFLYTRKTTIAAMVMWAFLAGLLVLYLPHSYFSVVQLHAVIGVIIVNCAGYALCGWTANTAIYELSIANYRNLFTSLNYIAME